MQFHQHKTVHFFEYTHIPIIKYILNNEELIGYPYIRSYIFVID